MCGIDGDYSAGHTEHKIVESFFVLEKIFYRDYIKL